MLSNIFTERNQHLSRPYALVLYWSLSRILETYDVPKDDYDNIRDNFETLNSARIEAGDRDYSEPDDQIYFELTQSMSRGTDGSERIAARHNIVSQFLFDGIKLTPKPELDPQRSYTHEEKLILYRRAGGRCQLEQEDKPCDRSIDFEDAVIDHVQPHSKGGRTTLDNGRVAFKSCNIARGNRDTFDPETMCCLLPEAEIIAT